MQVRDITTVKEWWDAYSLTIPVLTFADAHGKNEVCPKFHHYPWQSSCGVNAATSFQALVCMVNPGEGAAPITEDISRPATGALGESHDGLC